MFLEDYIFKIISLACIQLIAVISPGPDFAVVLKNSLIYPRKIGFFTALGVAAGTTIHLAYCLLGFGMVISQTVWLFNLIKILGCLYLFYIGCKSFTSQSSLIEHEHVQSDAGISMTRAFWLGFLTNVLNPKAVLFFLSIITTFITPTTSWNLMLVYGMEIILVTFMWFGCVAFCFSNIRMRTLFSKFGCWIERVTGLALILLGLKLAALTKHST